jgi:DNA ligase D-like protein (predicted polymerase)/DNA ligase D-like protein (predicted 3'-phosphoesterase)
MAFEEYKKKRNFATTSEPEPDEFKKNEQSIYVVQKHNARRIHFDFRIGHDGVLKSWAVPKGLSDDPRDKRLAIRTEDHPVAYATFSGEIPEGEYGAGTVEIWDKGKFVNITIKGGKVQPLSEALEKGHFIIYLKGDKLNGTYAFTRLDQDNWVIVKKREPHHLSTEISVGGHRITITHPQKELDTGISKAELVEYYRDVASLMLPHVKDRLVSMFRFPDGVHGEKFFQKNIPDYFPKWLEHRCLKHESGVTCYAIVKDEAAIVYLGNQVVVPHIMVTRADKPGIPDKMIFDLDPSSPDVASLKSAATKLKGFLEALEFKPYIMTTGGRGYHIAVPITRELDNGSVRDFAVKVAQTLAKQDATVTTALSTEKRKGRIFIDVNRISAMQTAVAPYGARSEPGLPIASPFPWDELPNIGPRSYTIRNYPKEDVWNDFFANSVSITDVIKKLT